MTYAHQTNAKLYNYSRETGRPLERVPRLYVAKFNYESFINYVYIIHFPYLL